MKAFLTILLFASVFAPWQASALQITAFLDSFIGRSVTIQGLASGGGYGEFTVTSVIGDASSEFGDQLLENLLADDATFWAACLEPDELVSVGVEYIFNIELLRDAPTSAASGPMTQQGETWMERIFDYTGYDNMDALVAGTTAGEQYALQAAIYEAGYEQKPALDFNIAGGNIVVTGAGIDLAVANQYDLAASLPSYGNTNAYALINVGVQSTPGIRTIYEAQDFTIFTVPEPNMVALMGLGLLGLGFTARHFS